MESTNKTIIPLIIVFFILGVALGYVVHKPEPIVKVVEKENITTITVTVMPTPTLPPIQTPTPTSVATPTVSDFIVKDYYDPSKETPTYTMQLRNFGFVDPNTLSIRPGESVLVKITDTTLLFPMTLVLNSWYQKDLGTSGAAFITFNKKGIYRFKAIIRSGDPTIVSQTYAEGTISVY